MTDSLWGSDFTVTNGQTDAKKIIRKINNPKNANLSVKNTINSKKILLKEKLEIIRSNVIRILGKFAENTMVIRSRDELHKYIDTAITNGVIAINTRTHQFAGDRL